MNKVKDMLFRTLYTRNQRYQLVKLAEQPKLTLEQFKAQRQAILKGAEPFGKCPDDWIRSSLPLRRSPKTVASEKIIEVLRTKGEMSTAGLCSTLGYKESYVREKVLSGMLERGLVTRRAVTQTQGGKTFFWSAA